MKSTQSNIRHIIACVVIAFVLALTSLAAAQSPEWTLGPDGAFYSTVKSNWTPNQPWPVTKWRGQDGTEWTARPWCPGSPEELEFAKNNWARSQVLLGVWQSNDSPEWSKWSNPWVKEWRGLDWKTWAPFMRPDWWRLDSPRWSVGASIGSSDWSHADSSWSNDSWAKTAGKPWWGLGFSGKQEIVARVWDKNVEVIVVWTKRSP